MAKTVVQQACWQLTLLRKESEVALSAVSVFRFTYLCSPGRSASRKDNCSLQRCIVKVSDPLGLLGCPGASGTLFPKVWWQFQFLHL